MELGIYCLMLILLIFLGVPIGFSLVVSGIIYVTLLSPLDPIVIPQKMIAGLNSFPLLAVPFFLILGEVMGRTGITERLVKLADAMVGHIRGGLGHVNILGSLLMGGIQGAATADTAAIGSMLIPAMKKDGYTAGYAAAITAASSAAGPIIPPSLAMVIYGTMGNVSIGRLFLAGAAPGLIVGLFLIIYNYLISKKLNFGREQHKKFSLVKLGTNLKSGFLPLLIPIIVVGGIVGGIFTPTESGAMATIFALVIGVVFYRQFGWRDFLECSLNTLFVLGSILVVVAGAATFSWILNAEGAGAAFGTYLQSISSNPLVIMLIINFILLLFGCFIETIALILLFTPIFLPIVTSLGFDPVHFGVIMVLNLTIGMTTPPLGLCIFVACSIGQISLGEFMKDMLPLYIPMIAALLAVIWFPEVVMYLPDLLMPIK
jgi:tripartite ATP-independent transporter DctM subunit